ncbi:hypothetical protein DENSPDRAFT_844356 [Dentipellis sp. KUC8613]|nr:hypothetical protein DENSPDRAFT_844356 [Dentipellis sp. KUC8613]
MAYSYLSAPRLPRGSQKSRPPRPPSSRSKIRTHPTASDPPVPNFSPTHPRLSPTSAN